MLALFLAVAVSATPGPPCAGGDPAVSDVRVKLVKKRNAPDHYIITATVSNAGAQAQLPGIVQRVELVEDGAVAAQQSVPALGMGVAYYAAFAMDRPSALRKRPFPVTIRYVFVRDNAARNNCNTANDVLVKVF